MRDFARLQSAIGYRLFHRNEIIGCAVAHEAAGATIDRALDLPEQEPVDPSNPLLKMENVVVGPHIAGKSQESYPRRVKFAFENMVRVWDGDKPESLVGL